MNRKGIPRPTDTTVHRRGLLPAGLRHTLLRRRAEAAFRTLSSPPQQIEVLSPQAVQSVLHELRVHQIQLEMQNESLRQTQLDLEVSRARYLDIYELAPVGYCLLDQDGLILEANLTTGVMLGLPRGHLKKKPLNRFIFPDDQEIYYLQNKKLAENDAPQVCDLRMVRQDKSVFWARLNATVTRGDDHAAPIYRTTMSDITEYKELERQKNHLQNQLHNQTEAASIDKAMTAVKKAEQLECANGELRANQEMLRQATLNAESASRAKSDFLANMSHEIRTPLTAIMGFTEFLLEPITLQADRQLFASTIRRNGKHLTELIDNILDLAKIEAGRLIAEFIPCSLPALMAEVTSLLKKQALDKGVYLRITATSNVPERIATDPLRLKQTLINILGNAVKFTDQGGVDVAIGFHKPSDDSTATIEFSVTDTGRGLAPGDHSQIFQPFMQADNSTTRRFGGTGLGLSLARSLARALGGDVQLTASVPGSGSTFTVTIETPLAEGSFRSGSDQLSEEATTVGWSPSDRTRLSGIHVLVVDDALDNQAWISRLLKSSGARVTLADNGDEAVQKAMQGGIDLVLMDLQMPKCDGFHATAELRRRGFDKPILALSAAAMREDRGQASKAGCNDHLAKPISRQQLMDKVCEYTDKGRELPN